NLRLAGGQDLAAPVLHGAKTLPVIVGKLPVTPRAGESIAILGAIIELDVAVAVRRKLHVAGERDVGRVVRPDGFLVGFPHPLHAARPTDRAMVLVVELEAEAAGIV